MLLKIQTLIHIEDVSQGSTPQFVWSLDGAAASRLNKVTFQPVSMYESFVLLFERIVHMS